MGFLGEDIFGAADFLDITGSKSGREQANKIAGIQRKAYDDLKGVSTADQDKAALDQALKNYQDQQAFLRQYSPGAYTAYQKADEAIGTAGAYAPTATKNATNIADQS